MCATRATLKCSACKSVFYCSKEHQRLDWRTHKVDCPRLSLQRAETRGAASQDDDIGETETLVGDELSGEAELEAAICHAGREAAGDERCCSICLEALEGTGSTTRLPCQHEFHARCVHELRRCGVNDDCPLCRAPLPPGPMALCREAMELKLRGRFDQAEVLLRRALREDPDHPQSLNNLGNLLRKTPEGLEEARTILERLVDLENPVSMTLELRVFARTNLATVALSLGDAAASERHVDAALRLDGDDPVAWYLRAKIARGRGDPETAEAALHRAMEADPTDTDIPQLLATVLMDKASQATTRPKDRRKWRSEAPKGLSQMAFRGGAVGPTGCRSRSQQYRCPHLPRSDPRTASKG